MTNFDIIFLLVVVFIVFQRLRAVLGTRPAETPFENEKDTRIFNIILESAEKQTKSETLECSPLTETDKVLTEIPGFNKDKFLMSAKKAFELIVESFAKADTSTLEMLLHPKLYKKFIEVIHQREEEGITAETDFIGFDKAEITNAKINKNNTAKISVCFVSEQINLLKNKAGEIIEGDENFIQNITDVWTFERALTSASPNWLLVSTKKS